MSISREEVAHVAQLSRLSLSAEETERMREELAEILEYMKLLDTAGTEDIAPAEAMENVLREDAVRPSADRAVLLRNAAVQNGESIVVPKTVE